MKKASKMPRMEIRGRRPAQAREVTNYGGGRDYTSPSILALPRFVGYDNLSYESEVTVLGATDTERQTRFPMASGEPYLLRRPHSMPPAAARRRIKESSAPQTANYRGGCGKNFQGNSAILAMYQGHDQGWGQSNAGSRSG